MKTLGAIQAKQFRKLKWGVYFETPCNLLPYFGVSDNRIIDHDVEHGKTENSVIFYFYFGKLQHTLFKMIGLIICRFSKIGKSEKSEKHADFGLKLLHCFRVSDKNIIYHDEELVEGYKTVVFNFFEDFFLNPKFGRAF